MSTEALAIVFAVPAIYVLLLAYQNSFKGVCLFVFLSSITMTPALPVVGDRFSIADAVMIPTLIGAMVRGEFTRKTPYDIRHIELFANLFIAFCTISSILAILQTSEPDRLVLFMLMYVYGYFSYRLIVRIVDTPDKFVKLCAYWLGGASLVVLVGVLAATGIYRPDWAIEPVINRVSSTMKTSAQISSYVGPIFFGMVFLAARRDWTPWKRVAATSLVYGTGMVLMATGSRISFVILLFSFLYSFWVLLSTSRTLVRKGPILAAGVLAVAVFSAFAVSVWTDTSEEYSQVTTSPFERPLRMFSETSRLADAGLEDWGGTRYDETSAVVKYFTDHPILGIGSGMFTSVYEMNEVHDTYMSVLGENGIIAFAFFMAWWLSIAARLLWAAIHGPSAQTRYVFKLVLGAFLALSIYQTTTNGLRQRPFWFTPGIAVAALLLARGVNEGTRRERLGHVSPSATAADI